MVNNITDELKNMGERVYLKEFKVDDISEDYVNWLNDPDVNQFLSIRGTIQDIKMVKEYVASFAEKKNKMLLGLFDKNNGKHIGNITFSSIDHKNCVGIIGIAIGDKAYWGKGIATEALNLAVNFAFSVLKLHKLEAGVSANNVPSQKLFAKAGFSQEGLLKEREKFGSNYVDVLVFGLLDYQRRKNESTIF